MSDGRTQLRALEECWHREMEAATTYRILAERERDPRRREILTKLRIPASLPYLFTALKISSTACVIGALIAEMTGTQQGLGWNLVYFAQYYNTNPPNLWAAIVAAGVLGLIFYGIIVVIEQRVVKWHPRTE